MKSIICQIDPAQQMAGHQAPDHLGPYGHVAYHAYRQNVGKPVPFKASLLPSSSTIMTKIHDWGWFLAIVKW